MKTQERSVAWSRPGRALLASVWLLGALALFAATHASAAGSAARVGVQKTAIGTIIANGQGHTLYMFAADKHGTSACYGSCATYWPPFLTNGKPVAVKGAKASLLGTTRRKDGKLQVTYRGRPLYLYVGDSKAGQASGQGLNLSGGLWWAVAPNGALDKKMASSGGGSAGGSGGGGYGGGGGNGY